MRNLSENDELRFIYEIKTAQVKSSLNWVKLKYKFGAACVNKFRFLSAGNRLLIKRFSNQLHAHDIFVL